MMVKDQLSPSLLNASIIRSATAHQALVPYLANKPEGSHLSFSKGHCSLIGLQKEGLKNLHRVDLSGTGGVKVPYSVTSFTII